jgi:hypothetical protein
MGYNAKKRKNISAKEKARMNWPKKHIIHKAFLWKKMLDEGKVGSLNEIAAKEGVTRARVTQIMNLLKLPAEMHEFLLGLDEPKEIRKYSERRLRSMKKSSLTGMM